MIGNYSEVVYAQRTGIDVSICVQDRLKTILFLSEKIWDSLSNRQIDNMGKSFKLIKKPHKFIGHKYQN